MISFMLFFHSKTKVLFEVLKKAKMKCLGTFVSEVMLQLLLSLEIRKFLALMKLITYIVCCLLVMNCPVCCFVFSVCPSASWICLDSRTSRQIALSSCASTTPMRNCSITSTSTSLSLSKQVFFIFHSGVVSSHSLFGLHMASTYN